MIQYCVNGMPQKDTLDNVAYTCMLSNPIDVFHLFQFSLSAATHLSDSEHEGSVLSCVLLEQK
jgi:hypothetical protein